MFNSTLAGREPVEITEDGGSYWKYNGIIYESPEEAWDAYRAYLAEVEEED